MATANVAGLDYTSPVTEFNVRPQPGTVPNEVVFKAAKGTANCEILDVQPDNQNTKQQNGQVYLWFQLRFPDGQVGWLRSHVLTIEGDLTAFGFGVLATATYAYKLTRVIPTAPATAPTLASPAPTSESEVTSSAPTPAAEAPTEASEVTSAPAPEPTAPSVDLEVTVTPAPGPVPTTTAPAAPQPSVETAVCAGTVTAARGARLRQSPVDGELITIVPFEAVVAIQEIRTVPGESLRWVRLSYDQSEGWTREDLLSYSGDCGRFNLTVTSPTAAQAVEFTAYSGAGLYPIPMKNCRFVRGFTGPQPNHPGIDFGAEEGEDMLAGPVGGLVVAAKDCARCQVPGKPSTVSQGLTLGDPSIFTDEGWNFGFGHYVIVRYLNNQLPPATQQTLASRGMPGAHIYAMYAHLSRRDVQEGAVLEPHHVIGGCGNTGNSTGTHLHLELRASTNPSFPGWAAIESGLVDPVIMFEH